MNLAMRNNCPGRPILILFGLIFLFIQYSVSLCQEAVSSAPNLGLEQIISKADSMSKQSDSLGAATRVRYRLFAVMNRLKGDGSIKSSDTTIATVTRQGEEEISREIIYSTQSSEGKSKKEERKYSFSFDDPAYKFSLTSSDDSSYGISVVPKSSPPREGEYVGTVNIDNQRFFLRRFDLEVPDPEGALDEFAIEMSFELLEGELVVPVTMKMRGFVKALLGLIRVRFSGEFRFSDYEIVQ